MSDDSVSDSTPATAALRDWPCTNRDHLGLCSDDHVHADHVRQLITDNPPSAGLFEQLRDAAVAELPKVCDHIRSCACRRRWIERFIYVGVALSEQGWVVTWPRCST